MRRAYVAAVTGALIVLPLAACDAPDPEDSSTATSTTIAFPYPALQFYTEIAIPLEEPRLSAVEFALDMKANDLRMLDPQEFHAIREEFRAKVAPEVDNNRDPSLSIGYVDKTGGVTLRAVEVREPEEGVVEVSVCIYNTPGQYTLHIDGSIGEAVKPYHLRRPRVQWTDRPAADGSVPDGPRWLFVDDGVDLSMTDEIKVGVCEPFKPDPFIQKMPDPTEPTTTPGG